MDVAFIFIFLISLLLVKVYLRKWRNLPPGPIDFPLLGTMGFNLQLIRRMQNERFQNILIDASKRYGPIIHLKMFNTRTVCLLGYDVIHKAFVKQADVFSDRPQAILKRLSLDIYGKGIIWSSGEEWRGMRRFALQCFRELGVGKAPLEEKILQEVDDMSQVLTTDDHTDIGALMKKAVANVIHGLTFGSRFDYNDPELLHFIEIIAIIFGGPKSPDLRTSGFLSGFIRDRLAQKSASSYRLKGQAVKWIHDYTKDQIRSHEETYDSNNIRDFVDRYIQATRNDNNIDGKDSLSELQLLNTLLDLFIAGSETTSNALSWTILYMVEYPDIQTRCQQEMEKVFGQRRISWSDRGRLPFVEATLLEIQRLANPAPVAIQHTTNVDTTLMGYCIPKGTIVYAILTASNMDTKYWDDPEQFRPERFISETDKVLRKDAYIPFSIGPRKCVGESLARMQLFLTVANLLQRFTFSKADSGTPLSLKPKLNQILDAPQDYKVVAAVRL